MILNRLKSGTAPSAVTGMPNLCWSYDAFGNRLSQNLGTSSFSGGGTSSCSGGGTTGGSSATYSANNQLISGSTWQSWPTGSPVTVTVPVSSYAAGNITSDGNSAYLYDEEGRVCAMQGPTVGGITPLPVGYIYDAEGNRTAKGTHTTLTCSVSDLTLTNVYLLGPDGKTITELDGSGSWLHTDVSAGDQMATYDADGLHFRLADWLGTQRVQTDYAGVVENKYQHLPFGELVGSDAGATEKHFTGQEHDTESMNDYFKARYMASAMGRFMSPDYSPVDDGPPDAIPFASISNPQSLNGYAYVGNNPMTGTDPDGHDCLYLNDDNTLNHWQPGDCTSSTDSGYYVNGSISTIYENSQGQVTGYSGTSYDSGNLMTGSFASSLPYGPLEGPENQAGLNLLANTSATVGSVRGVATFYGASAAIAACIVGCPAAGAAALTAIRGLAPVAALSLPAGTKVAQMIARAGSIRRQSCGLPRVCKRLNLRGTRSRASG